MYFAGVGWVRFEPTPGSARRRDPGVDPAGHQRRRPERGAQQHHGAEPGTGRTELAAADSQTSTDDGISVPWWPVAGLGLLVLRGRRAGRAYAARSVGAVSVPHDPVHLAEGAWAELHATALDLGLDWPEQRSPREQARSVVGQVSGAEHEAVASLEGLLVQVERGRYGRGRAPVTDGRARRCAHAPSRPWSRGAR